MRVFTIVLFIFVSNMLNAQYRNTDYFYKYLKSKQSEYFTHSIDSIYYGNREKFIVTEKTALGNVSKADIYYLSHGWIPSKKILNIDYYDNGDIENYLIYNPEYSGVDTFTYLNYRKDGILSTEQYGWQLDCGTGNPYTNTKTNYKYDQSRNLINKTLFIKWDSSYYLSFPSTWSEYNKIDFVYKDNKLTDKYFYANNWFEGNDTFVTGLNPISHEYRTYYDFDSIYEKYIEAWNKEDSIWEDSLYYNYYYLSHETFIELSEWDYENEKWNKKSKESIYSHENHNDVLKQKWNSSDERWDNYSKEVYEYSGIQEYFNYCRSIWEQEKWLKHNCEIYSQKGDTIFKEGYNHPHNNFKRVFLYDSLGKLIEKWSYSSPNLNKALTHYIFTYDNYGNIVEANNYEYGTNYTIKYYWSIEKGSKSNYVPLVDPANKWNIEYRNFLDRPSYTLVSKFNDNFVELDGKEYLALNNSRNGYTDTISSYFREENGKVWRYFDDGEKLWFDFTLEVGDSFPIDNETNYISIDSVNYLTMENGELRKRLFLKCFDGGDHHTIWIEGIGGLNVLENRYSSCITGQNTSLLCFHRNDELVLGSEKGCWVVGTRNPVFNELSIKPNPANSEIKINSIDGIEEVKILNISGTLLKQAKTNTIDISNLNSGLYIVKMKSNDKIFIGKFVKM